MTTTLPPSGPSGSTAGRPESSRFALDEDERAIVETARDFAQGHVAPGALEWDRDSHFPVDVLRTGAAMGLGGIYVREEYGGSGLRRVDAARIFTEIAAACPAIAGYISIHNMVAWMIDEYGTDAQRSRWLPGLCSMDLLGSYCLTEPGAGSDAAALRTRAVKEGEGADAVYVLDGVKQFISGAGTSDVYIVMARTGSAGPGGISAFVVEDGTPGLSFGANESKMGWHAQPTRQVILEGARVPAANLIGGVDGLPDAESRGGPGAARKGEGAGFSIAMNGLNGGRINIAACSLGGARAAFEKAQSYMREREAFGKPLGANPALQFELADMATQLEAARLMLWRAADALDTGAEDKVTLCAMAKRYVTDVGFEVANTALQLHGGYGYLAEYGLEKIVRDLRVHQILEGTNEIMRMIVGRAVA